MRQFIIALFSFIFGYFEYNGFYQGLSFAIVGWLIYRILFLSSEVFVFREFTLLLYALNYLIAPNQTYQLAYDKVMYGMKITPDVYFPLAFSGFISFTLGVYALKTDIFKVDFSKIKKSAIINENFLKGLTLGTLLLSLARPLITSDMAFAIVLLSSLRFPSAFMLLSISTGKNWLYLALVMGFEMVSAFIAGMYHDFLMWTIFMYLFLLYFFKFNLVWKIMGISMGVILIFFIQSIKGIYRQTAWLGDASSGIQTVLQVGSDKVNSGGVFSEDTYLSTLNRSNQAWIFASTVDNMDRYQNFQGLSNVKSYLEAALLPRFLAPNKIKSGNKDIFNAFSGHEISSGTSMGLGVFADGYIAYGWWGVSLFGFILGLIFSLTFKIVERWSRISPFFVLMILPLLNYAVRPDCELQTTINHLTKGLLLLGLFVNLTKHRFSLESKSNQRKFVHFKLVNENVPKK